MRIVCQALFFFSKWKKGDKCVTGPSSAVSNVSNYRSSDSEFDPGQVPYFSWDWSWKKLRTFSSFHLIFKKICCQLQVKVCVLLKYWLGELILLTWPYLLTGI